MAHTSINGICSFGQEITRPIQGVLFKLFTPTISGRTINTEK